MIRTIRPIAEQSIGNLGLHPDLVARLRAQGIVTIGDLNRASIRSLQLAACTEWEITLIRRELAKRRHLLSPNPEPPKAA